MEWHSYRFETNNLILKSCPNTDEPWIKVSDEERVERWWNVPDLSVKLTKINCLTQYAGKPNSPLIKTVGRYNNKLVCLTAFNSQRQIENNWLLISDHTEIININPLFIEKSLEQTRTESDAANKSLIDAIDSIEKTYYTIADYKNETSNTIEDINTYTQKRDSSLKDAEYHINRLISLQSSITQLQNSLSVLIM